MGPRCSSAETQVCHRSYIIAARANRLTFRGEQVNNMNLHICENIVQNLKHTTKNSIKVGENLSLNTHEIIVNALVSQIKLKFAPHPS